MQSAIKVTRAIPGSVVNRASGLRSLIGIRILIYYNHFMAMNLSHEEELFRGSPLLMLRSRGFSLQLQNHRRHARPN